MWRAAASIQFPFEAPKVAEQGTFQGDFRLLYLSTIMVEAGPLASLDLYYETAQFTGFLHYGVTHGLELQLAVPVSVDYEGHWPGRHRRWRDLSALGTVGSLV